MHTFRVWATLPKRVEVQVGGHNHAMRQGAGRLVERRRLPPPGRAAITASCSTAKARSPIRAPRGSPTACTPSRAWWTTALSSGATPASARRRSRGGHLRAAHRHLHAGGHVRSRRSAKLDHLVAARRHARRADAGGGVLRQTRLGLRRRGPVRAAPGLRRTGRTEEAGERLPRPRPGGPAGRGLQPPRPLRQLPRQVRALLQLPLSHALGLGRQLRRRRTATRCAASSATTR